MSGKLTTPTKEQEEAALNISDWQRSCYPQCAAEDVALLLAEREAVLVDVICRLRACLHEALCDEERQQCMSGNTYEEGYKALRETVQYEVVK